MAFEGAKRARCRRYAIRTKLLVQPGRFYVLSSSSQHVGKRRDNPNLGRLSRSQPEIGFST